MLWIIGDEELEIKHVECKNDTTAYPELNHDLAKHVHDNNTNTQTQDVLIRNTNLISKASKQFYCLKYAGHGAYNTDLIHEAAVHHHKCLCDSAWAVVWVVPHDSRNLSPHKQTHKLTSWSPSSSAAEAVAACQIDSTTTSQYLHQVALPLYRKCHFRLLGMLLIQINTDYHLLLLPVMVLTQIRAISPFRQSQQQRQEKCQ